MKYTPGPWKWTWTDGPTEPPQLEGNIKYSDQSPILVTHGCSPSCMRKHGRPCPLVPSKEDMALIAAAPQLLEACRLAAKMWFNDDEGRAAVYACRAAITAAESRA